MTAIKGKGPIVDPGLCRCCGSLKKCRVLNAEYEWTGQKEIYTDMIMECFGISQSHLDGPISERLVCATCVSRLRDAYTFKKQVLQCEEAFLRMKIYDREDPHTNDVSAKSGFEKSSDRDYFSENLMDPDGNISDTADVSMKPECDDDDSSSDDLPIAKRKDFKNEMRKLKIKIKIPKQESDELNEVLKIKSTLVKPLHPLVRKKLLQRQITTRRYIPMSLPKQEDNENDLYYMKEANVLTLIENSYVCPFRCRHNNIYCYYCKQHYSDPKDLREHVSVEHHPKKFKIKSHRQMTKIDITRIDCRLCPERIFDIDVFKEHITKLHGKKLYSDVPFPILTFRLTKDQLTCTMCDRSFMFFHALNQHMNEHFNNFVCETCGLGFLDQSRLTMHIIKHEDKNFPCEVCGKVFKTEAYKDLHVDRIHNKIGRIYCPKCDVRLMTYPQKLKHLVQVHGEQPLCFPCTSCERVFDSRRTLTIHLRRDHWKDYRYECQYCGQRFFTRFSLRNHMPTHTGERNFKCKVCEKSYPRRRTLKEHMRIHNNDRRYKCQICGQAFIQNCSLKGHMKSQHPEYG